MIGRFSINEMLRALADEGVFVPVGVELELVAALLVVEGGDDDGATDDVWLSVAPTDCASLFVDTVYSVVGRCCPPLNALHCASAFANPSSPIHLSHLRKKKCLVFAILIGYRFIMSIPMQLW